MSTPKFTLGPWVTTLDEHGYWIVAEKDGCWLACTDRGSVGMEEQKANANLMSKAPDLYDRVEELTDALSIWEGEGTLPKEWEKLLSDAVDTLREVRGEK